MFQFWLYNLQAVKCKKKLIQMALSEPDIFQGVETWNIIMQITNL